MGDSFIASITGLAPPSFDPGLDKICHSGNTVREDREDLTSKLLGATYPCDLNATEMVSFALGGGLLLMVISVVFMVVVKGWPMGDINTVWGLRVNRLGELIEMGVKSFFFRTSLGIAIFMIIFFILILIIFSSLGEHDGTDGIRYASAYFMAIVTSLIFVSLAMSVVVGGIVRTARQATLDLSGLGAALRTAFGAGTAAAYLLFAGLLVLFTLWFLILTNGRGFTRLEWDPATSCNTVGTLCGHAYGIQSMIAWGVGMSTVALIFRTCAGVFAKAAEIGSEILFDRELEEDTFDKLRNPATMSDKIGAVVMDCGGVFLDIAESMFLAMLSMAVLAQGDVPKIMLAFWLPTGNLFAGLIGWLAVRCDSSTTSVVDRNNTVLWGVRYGLYTTAAFIFLFSAVVTGIIYTDLNSWFGGQDPGWEYFAAHLVGLLTALIIWEGTAFFTSHRWFPTKSVTAAGLTGPATFFVQGFGVAMISPIPTLVALTVCAIVANSIGGNFGVACAAVGICSPLGFAMAASCVSPIVYGADDALDSPDIQRARETTVPLVMAGESLAAEVRGWSIGVSIITAFAVMGAFDQEAALKVGGTLGIDYIGDGLVFGFAVAGALTIVCYAGINTLAVGKTTRALFDESIRQFKENQDKECDPPMVVAAAIYPAVMGVLLPAFYMFLVPTTVGFLAGPRALLGFIIGAILAGGAISIVFCNVGASWAKSKTAIEAESLYGGAGEAAHMASVAGARAGGPLKDVAGPTMITAIKGMAAVALFIAPTIQVGTDREDIQECLAKFFSNDANLSRYVRSWEHCFDWHRPYWFIIPALLLLLVTAFFYFFFWRLDGTGPGKAAEIVEDEDESPNVAAYQAPMMMGPPMISQPQLVQYVQQQPQLMQSQMMAMPAPQLMAQPQMRMMPPEPMLAAPMRPEMASVDNFLAGGYQVTAPM